MAEILAVLKIEKENYQEQVVNIKNQAVDALMEKEKEISLLKSTISDYQKQMENLYEKLNYYSDQQSLSKGKTDNSSVNFNPYLSTS